MEYILVLKASSQMINYKGKLIVIAGPTASGKSDIASRLAKDIGGIFSMVIQDRFTNI